MAQFAGNGVTSNGLVYIIDTKNPRSYAGPPFENIVQSINPVATSGTNIEYTTGYVNANIPKLGPIYTPYVNGYNSNSASYCCMQQYYFTNNNGAVSAAGTTTYTYSIVYKCTSGYTHPNYMYRYEYTASDVYVTEAGVFDTSKRLDLGDGWYWAWNTFTTQPTTAKMTLRSFYYQYNVSDIFYIAKAFVTSGAYDQLNPVYWPNPGAGFRPSTQVFRDPLGKNTYTVSNLNYASNGEISFNSVSSVITSPNNTDLDTQTPTVEVWVRPTSLNQNGFWFEKGTVNTQYALFQEGTAIVWRTYNNPSSYTSLTAASSNLSTTAWNHVVATYTSGSKKIYVNGVEVASDTSSGTLATNAGGMTVGSYNSGGYFFDGRIGTVRVYNRALSADEVRQNFNATRGQYGV